MFSVKNVLFSFSLLFSVAYRCYADNVPVAEDVESVRITIEITKNERADWEEVVHSFYDLGENMAKTNVHPTDRLDSINQAIKAAITDGASGEMKIEFYSKEEGD